MMVFHLEFGHTIAIRNCQRREWERDETESSSNRYSELTICRVCGEKNKIIFSSIGLVICSYKIWAGLFGKNFPRKNIECWIYFMSLCFCCLDEMKMANVCVCTTHIWSEKSNESNYLPFFTHTLCPGTIFNDLWKHSVSTDSPHRICVE